MDTPLIKLILPHELTDSELSQAMDLPLLTVMHLENEKMRIIQEIVTHTYTPQDKEGYGVKLAYLQGKLDMVTWLLATADEIDEQQIRRASQDVAEQAAVDTISPAELFKTIQTGENSSF